VSDKTGWKDRGQDLRDSRWGTRDPVPCLGPGQVRYLCAGVTKQVYSVRLSGAKKEIPIKRGSTMPAEEIFATGRVVERLLVCVFAGLSLTYGWNLFRVGVLTEQSAELTSKGWRVNLKRVGPGVFFALFGCIVLSISLKSPLTLPIDLRNGVSSHSNNVESSLVTPTPSQATYLERVDDNVTKEWVASLNTILSLATPDAFPNQTQKRVVARTDEDLETLRNSLVIRKFGAELFRDYNTYQKQRRNGDVQGTPEKFQQIEEWMQGNRIQE
jgi:hypothetical protein